MKTFGKARECYLLQVCILLVTRDRQLQLVIHTGGGAYDLSKGQALRCTHGTPVDEFENLHRPLSNAWRFSQEEEDTTQRTGEYSGYSKPYSSSLERSTHLAQPG